MPGQHWLEVAQERIRAGEPEVEVMADYGYSRTPPARTPPTDLPCRDCEYCQYMDRNCCCLPSGNHCIHQAEDFFTPRKPPAGEETHE